MDPGILKDRVEVRLRRQQLLDSVTPPRYRVLIDEAVLHRPTGGPEVMAAQIDRILERIDEGKVTAQIVPFDAGAIASQDSNFVLLEFGDSVLSSVIFVESLLNNQILEKQSDVDRYREALEHLRDSALTPRESKNRMTQLRNSYDTTGRLRYRRSPGRPYLRKDTYGDVPIGLRQSQLALVARLRRRRVHHGGAR
jgi:hypothetical protein